MQYSNLSLFMNVKRNFHFPSISKWNIGYEHIPISSTTMIFYLVTLSLSNTKLHTMNCLFACLFWFSSHLRIFHSYGEVIITSEGVQILIYARYPLPLSSEGFLVCHTHLLWHGASAYIGHPRGPVTLTPIVERLAAGLSLPVFTT